MIPPIDQYQGLNITFQVTEDCNLRCKYCYEVNKKPGTLPFDYAKRFVDIILTDPDPINAQATDSAWLLNQGLILDFIGGDALMVPDLCDKILTYFQFRAAELKHRWAYRWRASISTNGTLFSKPEVQNFLMKYKGNLSIGISIDGCPEIHDRNRIFQDGSGTMQEIMKWWDWYIGYMGIHQASTKATCNKDSIPYLYKSIKFLHEDLGLRHININFIFEDMHLTKADLQQLDQEMEKTIYYILDHRHEMHVNMFDQNFGIGGPMKDPGKGWCGSGSMPCLSINGKIYPCFRFTPNTMHKNDLDFSVGDVWTGLTRKENFEIVRKQTRDKISPQKCKDCSVESNCAWCIGGAFAEKGEFYRQTNICEVHKLQSKWAAKYWEEYKKREAVASWFAAEQTAQ